MKAVNSITWRVHPAVAKPSQSVLCFLILADQSSKHNMSYVSFGLCHLLWSEWKGYWGPESKAPGKLLRGDVLDLRKARFLI